MVAATTMEVDMDQRATPGMASVMVQSFRSVTDMQDVFESPQRIGSNASSFGSVKVVGAARSLVSSVRNSDGSVREDAKEIQPEDGQRDYHGPARISPWWSVSFNVLAEIMGTGILSLPSTVAGLGYILGSLSILIFAFAVYYQVSHFITRIVLLAKVLMHFSSPSLPLFLSLSLVGFPASEGQEQVLQARSELRRHCLRAPWKHF